MARTHLVAVVVCCACYRDEGNVSWLSVAASEKAGAGERGRRVVARECFGWYGSMAKLYFVI